MTEYDYPPEATERYMSNQDRFSQWGGASQNLSAHRSSIGPSDYRRSYVQDGLPYGQVPSDYQRGRRRSRHHRDGFQDDGTIPYVHGTTQDYDPRMYPNQFGSQQASINGGMLAHNEMPPLEEYYDHIPSRQPSYQMGRTLSHGYNSHIPSTYPHMANSYMAPPIHVPSSAKSYSRRRRRSYSYDRDGSDGSYSSRSYSTDSFSSRDSRSYYDSGNPYTTVLPSSTNPTVIQPSRNHPIVVPINGGTGGYVVVPAVGQSMRVIDPSRPYKDLSFIDRVLSPSTWGLGRRKRRIIIS